MGRRLAASRNKRLDGVFKSGPRWTFMIRAASRGPFVLQSAREKSRTTS